MGAKASRSASPPPPKPLTPQAASAVSGNPSAPHVVLTTRFMNTHVTLSKGIYKPGETVYGRAILIDAVTHAPALIQRDDAEGATLKLQVNGIQDDAIHTECLSHIETAGKRTQRRRNPHRISVLASRSTRGRTVAPRLQHRLPVPSGRFCFRW